MLAVGCVWPQTHNEALDRNAQLKGIPGAESIDVVRSLVEEHAHRAAAGRDQGIGQQRASVPSGGYEMPDTAKASIAKIAKVLAPHQKSRIDVNGYTDTTPIGPGLAKQGITTNLILSQKRADDVMHYMTSQGVKADLVAAHGFGEASPVGPNDTAEGRARESSRRAHDREVATEKRHDTDRVARFARPRAVCRLCRRIGVGRRPLEL